MGFAILIQHDCYVSAANGEKNTCKSMEQIVPPPCNVVEGINRAEQGTEGIERKDDVEPRVQFPFEDNAQKSRKTNKRYSGETVEIVKSFAVVCVYEKERKNTEKAAYGGYDQLCL